MTVPHRGHVLIFLVLAIVGFVLGYLARAGHMIPGDVAVLDAIQALDFAGVETVVTISNAVFGTAGAIAIVVAFILAGLLLHRSAVVLAAIILFAIRLIGQVLKPTFSSPRPGLDYQPDPSLVSDTLGYPSGHAFTATCIAGLLVLFIGSLDAPARTRAPVVAVAVLLVIIAAFSRIRIGAHWPSDTAGGILFGLAAIALTRYLVPLIQPVIARWIADRKKHS